MIQKVKPGQNLGPNRAGNVNRIGQTRPVYSRKQVLTPKKKIDFRLWLWLIVILLIAGAIFHRLFVVQVLSHDELFSKAKSQHQYYEELMPKRGEIFFQNKGKTYPVAVNEEKDMVIAVPKNIPNKESAAVTLATTLNLPVEEVREKLTKNANDMYEVIKRKLTDEESLALSNKNLTGVELVPEYWRTYPASPVGSQVVGFVGYKGDEKIGQYGVEGYFNEALTGKGGFLKAEKDTAGRWISVGLRTLQKAEDGDSLVLTIEQSVQYFIERKLEEAVKKFDAISGSILIMEPKTGKIIAMANYPSYDNENYSQITDASLFQNACIQDQYEPGSIMKPMTYSVPLDLGKIEPETLYTDRGSISMSGFTMHNFDGKGRGTIPMIKALELSLNTGAIFAEQAAGKEKFYEYFKNFGFGTPLGIDLVGEANGDIRNMSFMKDLTFATASFGQGVSATPLQMVSAFSSLINGGKLMKPQIIEKVIKGNGEERPIDPKEIRQVISPKTSEKIKAMLVSVVKNGWSVKAAVPGYLIGGKTGTAQMPNPNGGGYLTDFIHSFIAGAPMNDPRFVVLVKLDRVKAMAFSSDTSSPIGRQILEFLFEYYNISPTEDITEKEKQLYKHYVDSLNNFLGTKPEEMSAQEANTSGTIQKRIIEGEDQNNANKNGNTNSNGNSNGNSSDKNNKNLNNNKNTNNNATVIPKTPTPGGTGVINLGGGD